MNKARSWITTIFSINSQFVILQFECNIHFKYPAVINLLFKIIVENFYVPTWKMLYSEIHYLICNYHSAHLFNQLLFASLIYQFFLFITCTFSWFTNSTFSELPNIKTKLCHLASKVMCSMVKCGLLLFSVLFCAFLFGVLDWDKYYVFDIQCKRRILIKKNSIIQTIYVWWSKMTILLRSFCRYTFTMSKNEDIEEGRPVLEPYNVFQRIYQIFYSS